jgi:hypothetical protein
LAAGRFAAKTPIMPIGFSWISLDSLVRIETFQWVMLDFRDKDFRGAFPRVERAGQEPNGLGYTEEQNCSCGQLKSAHDFLQSFVVRAVSSPASIEKHRHDLDHWQ